MKIHSEECQGEIELTPSDVVLEVGGYEGRGAAHLAKTGAKILVFEPVSAHYSKCLGRLAEYKNVTCIPFGMGANGGFKTFGVHGDSSGEFNDEEKCERVQIIAVSSAFRGHNWTDIALLRINIEGGEYELLEAMLTDGLVARCKLIQVQFHFLAPGHEERHWEIRQGLAKTHIENNPPHLGWETWRVRP